jgi:hypothetical protein
MAILGSRAKLSASGRVTAPLAWPHAHARLTHKPPAAQAKPSSETAFVLNIWGVGYRLVAAA